MRPFLFVKFCPNYSNFHTSRKKCGIILTKNRMGDTHA